MNTQLQIFENKDFGQIRTFEIGGKQLFCAADIAAALGYSNTRDAIARHCRYVVKHDIPHPQNAEKNISMNMISEGDVYRLITHSQLPSAEQFELWVFDEVLPSIRKHGAYATPQTIYDALATPDGIMTLFTRLKEEQDQRILLEQQCAQDKPKVLFADAVAVSDGTILIGELAKILKGNGVDIGQNRLFERLRQEGYLIKRQGTDFNAPTQKAMELGLFKVKETAVTHSDGHVTISKTTKVTGKGQQYFIGKFLDRKAETAC